MTGVLELKTMGYGLNDGPKFTSRTRQNILLVTSDPNGTVLEGSHRIISTMAVSQVRTGRRQSGRLKRSTLLRTGIKVVLVSALPYRVTDNYIVKASFTWCKVAAAVPHSLYCIIAEPDDYDVNVYLVRLAR